VKTYQGRREGAAVIVTVNNRPLNPRLDLWNHISTGFEWGYAGSGPAQLALAILADHLGSADEAVGLHQDFKGAVISRLPYPRWTLTSDQIGETLATMSNPPSEGGGDRRIANGAMKLSELLSQVTPPPWQIEDAGGGGAVPGVKLLAWRGTDPVNQVCIGRFASPADAQYASHAASLFFEVITALKLLLNDQNRHTSQLSPVQIEFCHTALADAERILLE
jgi:hypothetical protein